MLKIDTLVFNDFQVNTYIISGVNNSCFIIDPACYYDNEKMRLKNFILEKKYIPKLIINTHCHVDHIFGNQFIKEEFQINIAANPLDKPLLESAVHHAMMFGFEAQQPPGIDVNLAEPDKLELDGEIINILNVPGHSTGSIALSCQSARFVITGDALFNRSIGRTDLPGGNYDILIASINNKLMSLDEGTTVFPGHGPATTIGDEKRENPFLT